MGFPSVKMKARFVLLTMLLGSTLGVLNASHRGGFFAYGDPSNYESVDGGATHELAGGMLVLCQYSLEYTRSVLSGLEGDEDLDLTEAWKLLAKAEEQFMVAQIQMFEYQDYHASVQHSRRVLELCEDAVELVSSEAGYGDVLGGGASDYEMAWGAIERAGTLLNNLDYALSKLNDLDVSVIESVLEDARAFIELAELQLNTGELGAAEASVGEAMSLLGQAMDLLQYVSQDKKIDKVLTLIESYEEQLRELEAKIVDALVVTEDYEESLAYVVDVFQDARDKIEQLKNQLGDGDLNLVIDELETIFNDVLGSLSSIGWLDDSDMSPMLFQDKLEEEPKDEESEPEPEVEEEPAPEKGKSNNGNPQNDKDPQIKDEPEVEDEPKDEDEDEDSSWIDEVLDKIEEWYDRKKDKRDKRDKRDKDH